VKGKDEWNRLRREKANLGLIFALLYTYEKGFFWVLLEKGGG